MKLHKLILTAIAGSLLFVSCSDDDAASNKPSGVYDNGTLILNQGGFGHGDASVSFLSDTLTVENNIYAGANGGALLGDTGQDIGLKGDLAYIVMNVSNTIEVVNRYTFVKVATISTQLDNPRYIAFANGKGYVTNWGNGSDATDDYVAVIDLGTNTVTSKIAVAEGPERIIEENNKLYVTHKGGYGYGNTVTVINSSNNTIATTIPVGDVPNTLEVEDGKLYVMSEGVPSWGGTETAGKLNIINLSNNTVSKTIDFAAGAHPSNLVIEDSKIYYTIDNQVYVMGQSATTLPTTPLFTTDEQGVYGIYSFAVENNTIYVGDAGDYSSNGQVILYNLQGAMQHTFTVGVVPAGFYFND
jgi:YVTN family beta-propeller protein